MGDSDNAFANLAALQAAMAGNKETFQLMEHFLPGTKGFLPNSNGLLADVQAFKSFDIKKPETSTQPPKMEDAGKIMFDTGMAQMLTQTAQNSDGAPSGPKVVTASVETESEGKSASRG